MLTLLLENAENLKKKLKFQELDGHQTTPQIHLFSTEKISYSFFSYSFFRFFSSGTIKDAFKRTDENRLLIPLEFFPSSEYCDKSWLRNQALVYYLLMSL